MCGRYTLTHPEQIPLRFDIPIEESELVATYNVAPSQQIPAVFEHKGARVLSTMRWGFHPSWLPSLKRQPPINARGETIMEKSLFRQALLHHRCLLPATGFFEWADNGQSSKQPYYFRLRDADLFAFAGLYTKGEPGESCALITTRPNSIVAPVHNRMPVILSRDAEALWLDQSITEPDILLHCLEPYPAAAMIAYPVSRRVSSVRNNAPDLVEPVASPAGQS